MRAPLARLVELASHMDRSMHHIPRGRGSCLRVANAVPEHVLSWSVAALAAAVLLPFSGALMYDVVDPSKLPPAECASGCARWAHLLEDGAVLPPSQANWWASRFRDGAMYPANQSTVDAQWSGGAPPLGVGRQCANPAKTSLVAWPPYPREAPGTDTAFCFCAHAAALPKKWGDCRSAPSIPEQLNVVAGQDSSVVISFVTLRAPGRRTDCRCGVRLQCCPGPF